MTLRDFFVEYDRQKNDDEIVLEQPTIRALRNFIVNQNINEEEEEFFLGMISSQDDLVVLPKLYAEHLMEYIQGAMQNG